jgi:hypothetical protein
VKARIHSSALICTVAAWLCVPAAEAQAVRRAVPRPRTAVFIGAYYDPFVYHSFYPRWYHRPWGPWAPSYGFGYGFPYDVSASLRLQVTPRETEVFIDGYYAGTVDDFDGVFQRLRLEPGDHDVELYLAGYRSFQRQVYLQPGRTFRIRHTMEPLAAGAAPPVRPSGAALPPARPNPSRQAEAPAPSQRPSTSARVEQQESEFGAIALRVQPIDAEVLIDGERWERSTAEERLVVQLAPGVHRIEIRRDGYRSYFTDITVRPRETTTLNVAMTKQ